MGNLYELSFDVVQIKNDFKTLAQDEGYFSTRNLSIDYDDIKNIVIGKNGLENVDIEKLFKDYLGG
jgi:hypothetical protein